MKEIAKRLKYAREDIGLTQVEMAKEFNVSKQIYNNIEQAKRRLQIEEVAVLKYSFNLDPNWLIFGEGKMKIEDNIHKVELINLILDFRQYGGEVDIVKTEIIKKILSKLLHRKKLLKIIPIPSLLGHHITYAWMRILINSNFTDIEKNAKNYLRDQIEAIQSKNPLLLEIKKTLYSMLENVNSKDCYYLLTNRGIAANQVLDKINSFDRTFNEFLLKNDRELHKRIVNAKATLR
jgi:transcriptional regulator with XRE-family HTH domain